MEPVLEHRHLAYAVLARTRVWRSGPTCISRVLLATTAVMRVEASTHTDNMAEQRALQKAGFTREGVLRYAQFQDGQWRDLASSVLSEVT